MHDNETIRVNNSFNGLGPPVLCLIFIVYALWMFSVGWDELNKDDFGSIAFGAFMVFLGAVAIVIAIVWLKRLHATVAFRMELGGQVYVRWLFKRAYYEYRQISEARFRDFEGDLGKIPGVLRFSERHIDFTFDDGREADVTVDPQKEREILAGLRRKDVPVVFDTSL